jgi:hypothetical protein
MSAVFQPVAEPLNERQFLIGTPVCRKHFRNPAQREPVQSSLRKTFSEDIKASAIYRDKLKKQDSWLT